MKLKRKVGRHVTYVEEIAGRQITFRSDQPDAEARARKIFEHLRGISGVSTSAPQIGLFSPFDPAAH